MYQNLSKDPLSKIEADECSQDSRDLTAQRFRTCFNEIEKLRVALEPFGRHVGAESLVKALGHITRDDIERAKELTKPD